jgi:hypothetical protein
VQFGPDDGITRIFPQERRGVGNFIDDAAGGCFMVRFGALPDRTEIFAQAL